MNRLFSRKRTKKLIQRVIFILLVSLSLFYFSRAYKLIWPEISSERWESGIVVHVYDGDTFRMKYNHQEKRIRLLGVDAPEIGASSEKEDLWARIARRYSLYHLLKKEIRLSYEAQREDRYGRLLVYVWTDKNKLFNELILKEGLARYLASANLCPEMKDRLKQAEEEAKKAKKGIWQTEWPEAIKAIEAGHFRGEIKAVDFVCGGIKKQKGYTLLYARQGDFQVYLSRDRRPLFPFLEKIKPGDRLVVFGLIEVYQGHPQVILFYPQQIKLNLK